MENQIYQAPDNAVQPQQQGNPTPVLVLGIVGLALASTGIAGLIVSIIGLVKGKAYIAQYGNVSKQANIGRILSIVGLVLSIVAIVACIVLIIVMVVLLVNHGPEIQQMIEKAAQSSGNLDIRINF